MVSAHCLPYFDTQINQIEREDFIARFALSIFPGGLQFVYIIRLLQS